MLFGKRLESGSRTEYNRWPCFLMVIFGLFLVAWIFAILEIFWCCGDSDIEEEDIEDDDDPTKIYPEDDYDY
jgi:hypothetical protein